MKDIFGSPIYEDEFAGMEDYDLLAEDADDDLYEEYSEQFDERPDFF